MKPTAWINEYDGLEPFNPDNRQDWIPLYAQPKELTDEEIGEIALKIYDGSSFSVSQDKPWHHNLVRFVRAVLKEMQKK